MTCARVRMSTARTLSEATTGNNRPSKAAYRNTYLPRVAHWGTSDQPRVTTSRQAEMPTSEARRAERAEMLTSEGLKGLSVLTSDSRRLERANTLAPAP